ncbi:glutaredoxin domain-containing protein [Marinococcus halotolerans]|nr:glutaredoxin domain-containing protein [Marinococcus halotolerans]
MVTLYTIDGCPDCRRWRKTLENNQISFREKTFSPTTRRSMIY